MVVDLQESRKKIDDIDREIVSLFQKRMDVAADVAAYKKSTGKKVFDAKREEEKITCLREMAEDENRHRRVIPPDYVHQQKIPIPETWHGSERDSLPGGRSAGRD